MDEMNEEIRTTKKRTELKGIRCHLFYIISNIDCEFLIYEHISVNNNLAETVLTDLNQHYKTKQPLRKTLTKSKAFCFASF